MMRTARASRVGLAVDVHAAIHLRGIHADDLNREALARSATQAARTGGPHRGTPEVEVHGLTRRCPEGANRAREPGV